jgi:8-oxo-dGTP pyrophosphatase MutT (NUDIX family)
MTTPIQPPPSTAGRAVATPRPAATILLLRETGGAAGGGVEVFMVVRHREIDFASGALVFPGGRVEEGDFAVAARRDLCAGLEGLDPAAAAFRVAAIRETFEECGILLARPHDSGPGGPLVSAERLRAIEDAGNRAALCRNKIAFADLLAAERLTLAADRLAHYAHWITPALRPKRYDTHFFLAEAPPDQVAAHDGMESVESVWIDPRRALDETAAGRFTLVFATRLNLERLARAGSVAGAFAQAQAQPVVTVLPEEIVTETGRIMRIPAEAGYGGSEFDAIDPPAM